MKSLLQRRNEANARKVLRSKRSPKEQVALILQRPGNSTKELTRLQVGKLVEVQSPASSRKQSK